MKIREKWKRWLRRLDLAVMVWWAAYDTARMFFPKNYPPTETSDTVTIFGMIGFTMLAGWLKIYESEEVPEEDLRWMVRIRYGLFMWPICFGIIYQFYLWFLK